MEFAEIVRARIERLVALTGVDARGWVDVVSGAVVLVERLKSLREEGTALRPEVYVFSEGDKADLVAALGFQHRFQIGHVRKSEAPPAIAAVFTEAIKRCAPLARDGWSIFIKWNPENINFGVMRRVAGLTSRRPKEVLRCTQGLPVLLFYQAAEGVVSVRGPGDIGEDISFSAIPAIKLHRSELARRNLVKAIAAHTGVHAVREQTEAVVDIILNEALVSGHGFLVGVQPHQGEKQNERWEFHEPPTYQAAMSDGNYFPKWPIPLQSKLKNFQAAARPEAMDAENPLKSARTLLDLGAQLQGWVNLISKMLSSDGMTLFDTMGQVLGFSIFVYALEGAHAHPPKYPRPPARAGGARWRAFLNMCHLVDAGILTGAYFQSQDGEAAWYGPEPEA